MDVRGTAPMILRMIYKASMMALQRLLQMFAPPQGPLVERSTTVLGLPRMMARLRQRRNAGGRAGGVLWTQQGYGPYSQLVLIRPEMLITARMPTCSLVVVQARVAIAGTIRGHFVYGGAMDGPAAPEPELEQYGTPMDTTLGYGPASLLFQILTPFPYEHPLNA